MKCFFVGTGAMLFAFGNAWLMFRLVGLVRLIRAVKTKIFWCDFMRFYRKILWRVGAAILFYGKIAQKSQGPKRNSQEKCDFTVKSHQKISLTPVPHGGKCPLKCPVKCHILGPSKSSCPHEKAQIKCPVKCPAIFFF
jgi:hypothetical protein